MVVAVMPPLAAELRPEAGPGALEEHVEQLLGGHLMHVAGAAETSEAVHPAESWTAATTAAVPHLLLCRIVTHLYTNTSECVSNLLPEIGGAHVAWHKCIGHQTLICMATYLVIRLSLVGVTERIEGCADGFEGPFCGRSAILVRVELQRLLEGGGCDAMGAYAC